EAATAFAVTRAGNRIIPNDNLMYRQTSESSDVNIQDANLLKIKLTYLYKTKMPLTQYFFAPFVDANLTRTLFTSDLRHAPLTAPEAEGRVPLVAYATVRMQSDFKLASLEGEETGSGSTSASSGSTGSGTGSGSSGSGSGVSGSTGLNFSGSSGSSDSGNAGAGEEGCE
ncbi:MAG: hypothetical protein LBJ59_02770, partial [Zoogloeaceae bacterium]|nr:hypothetical protein [Zoogloeaceae bacterium]